MVDYNQSALVIHHLGPKVFFFAACSADWTFFFLFSLDDGSRGLLENCTHKKVAFLPISTESAVAFAATQEALLNLADNFGPSLKIAKPVLIEPLDVTLLEHRRRSTEH